METENPEALRARHAEALRFIASSARPSLRALQARAGECREYMKLGLFPYAGEPSFSLIEDFTDIRRVPGPEEEELLRALLRMYAATDCVNVNDAVPTRVALDVLTSSGDGELHVEDGRAPQMCLLEYSIRRGHAWVAVELLRAGANPTAHPAIPSATSPSETANESLYESLSNCLASSKPKQAAADEFLAEMRKALLLHVAENQAPIDSTTDPARQRRMRL